MRWRIYAALLGLLCLLTAGCGSRAETGEEELPDPETAVFATVMGSAQEMLVESLYPQAKVLRYDSFSDVMLALREEKADYALVAEQLTRVTGGDTSGYVVLRDDIFVGEVAAAVKKDNTELRDELNACIRSLREDGALEDMEDRWIVPAEQYSPEEIPEAEGKKGVLRVGTSAGYPPMEFVMEGDYVGYDMELAARLALQMDRKLEVVDIPFASLIAALATDQIDVILAGMTVTEERQQAVDFTEGYYEDRTVLLRFDPSVSGENVGFFTGLRASFRRTFLTEGRWKMILSGLWLTLVISLLFGIFGTALGFAMCLVRRSRNPIPRLLVDGLCALIRGIPMVVFLLVLNYVVFARLGLSGAAVSVIAFSLVFACSVCGMLTVGLDGVAPGELEAGLALGYTPNQVFFKIGLPQAVRQVLPLYRGEYVGTMKLTSIVGYIAVQDLTKVGDLIRSRTMEAFFPLIVTALLYFLLANLLSVALGLVERWVDPKHRKRRVKGVIM